MNWKYLFGVVVLKSKNIKKVVYPPWFFIQIRPNLDKN